MDEKNWIIKAVIGLLSIIFAAITVPIFEALSSKSHESFIAALKSTTVQKNLLMQTIWGVFCSVVCSFLVLDGTFTTISIMTGTVLASMFGYNTFMIIRGVFINKTIQAAENIDVTKMPIVKHVMKDKDDKK